jgi:rhodanese-related sulfurtransferase
LEGRPYADITNDETRWLQTHGALILDARRSDVYAAGHIPGARSLPVWEDGLQAKIAGLGAANADPLLPLVVYCAGGDCEDSHLLGQKLWLAGYRNVRIYTDGFPGWLAHGWPAHRGENP